MLTFWTWVLFAIESDSFFDIGVCLAIESLLVWRSIINWKNYKSPEFKEMQEKARADWMEFKASKPERKEQARKEREYKEKLKLNNKIPVSVILVDTQEQTRTKKSAIKATGRAVVGNALLGPAGAIIGAATTGSKTKVTGKTATFSVKYASGRTGIETVEINSKRFQELVKLLHR